MLPDFPQAKRMLREHLMEYAARAKRAALGPFSRIKAHRAFEGDSFSYETVDGEIVHSTYTEFSEKLILSAEECKTITMDQLRKKMDDIALKLASQQRRDTYDLLDKITADTGNVVDAGGALTAEHFFKLFEMIPIDFAEDGRPIIRFGLHVSPKANMTAIRTALERFQTDPQFKARREALLERKREEWRAREADRKLA